MSDRIRGEPGLAAFAGRWRLSRDIADHRDRKRGQFLGEAVFSPDAGGLRYVETGLLTFEGQAPLRAARQYLWREDGGAISVLFADGRPFYHFCADRARVSARHFCQPDEYRVTHDFGDWPCWRTHWRVEGPRKRYEMHAIYRRAAG